MDKLVEELRKLAPRRVEGQHNDFALFQMDKLNLQDLNAKINQAADRIEALQRDRDVLRAALEQMAARIARAALSGEAQQKKGM